MSQTDSKTQREALFNTFEARSRRAVEDGLEALWAEVARQFPECKSGDIDPATESDLHLTVLNAVRTWVVLNSPDERG